MEQNTLADDVTGGITRMAVQISSDVLSPLHTDMKLAYQNLLQSFSSDTHVLIFTDEAIAGDVKSWLTGLNLCYVPSIVALSVDAVTHTTAWMRDAFLRGERNGQQSYIKCQISRANADQAYWLSAIDGTPVVSLPDTFLDGGDSLVGPDFRLVGKNAVYHTGDLAGHLCKPAVALARLSALDTTRPLTVVGYLPRAIRNKSNWIRFEVRRRMQEMQGSTPLATNIPPILPISVALMRALTATITDLLLNRLSQIWLHIDQVVAVTGRKETGTKGTLLVAEIVPSGTSNWEEGVAADCLAALSEYLRGSGYKVINNPTRYIGGPLCYNNTIVQIDPDVVWVPQFSTNGEFSETDEANRKIWCDLGFEVRPVDGWMAFHQSSGAIRCATNVLARRLRVLSEHP